MYRIRITLNGERKGQRRVFEGYAQTVQAAEEYTRGFVATHEVEMGTLGAGAEGNWWAVLYRLGGGVAGNVDIQRLPNVFLDAFVEVDPE